jgi:phosphatidylglycerophosphate synthase
LDTRDASGYRALYAHVRAEFAASPKSRAPWDTGNSVSGRFFFRPAGLLLAPLFLRLGLSGNQVTFLSFLVGTLANGLFLLGEPRLFLPAALCFLGFAILDFSDGVVARHWGSSTHYGKMIDLLSGVLVSSLTPVCVGFGVARAGALPGWLEPGWAYLLLAALSTVVNLMNKYVVASFSLERFRTRGDEASPQDEREAGAGGVGHVLRRLLFHLTANTAHLVLLGLVLAGLAYLFPLLLLMLALVQLARTVVTIFRTGPRVLAIQKP